MQAKSERDSRFELLRIFAMLLIIGSHIAEHGDGNNWNIWRQPVSGGFGTAAVLGIWGQLGVSLFVILTSWFLCDGGSFHFRKVLQIILQSYVICILLAAVIWIPGVEPISRSVLENVLLGPFSNQYWFILTYLVFYMLTPFLRKAVTGMEDRQLRRLVLVLTVLIPVYRFFISDTGITGSLGDFCYLFLAAACLKRTRGNFLERHAVLGALLAATVGILSMFFLNYMGRTTGNTFWYAEMGQVVGRYPVMFCLAFCLFYIFMNHLRSFHSPAVNRIAGTVFGVYLIHENMLLRGYDAHPASLLWDGLLHMDVWAEKPELLFALYWVLCTVLVFALCSLLEMVRKVITDDLILGRMKWIGRLCDRFDRWYVPDNKMV
jgi:surface polysaccharide O-acyltransferase-like enzyme